MLTSAIAETRHDYRKLLELIEHGPIEPWHGIEFVNAEHLDPLFAEQGLDIISDARITDLRNLDPSRKRSDAGQESFVYVYLLVSVCKLKHSDGETGLRLQPLWDMPVIRLRCHNPELDPELRRTEIGKTQDGRPRYAWQLKLDFRGVPVGHTTNIVVEAFLPAEWKPQRGAQRPWWQFQVDADPEVAT